MSVRLYCSSKGLAAASRERLFGALALIGVGVGTGGVIGAALIPAKTVRPTATATRDGIGVGLEGSF